MINQGSNSEKRMVGINAVVGSGALVIADCEPKALYVSVPAQRLKWKHW